KESNAAIRAASGKDDFDAWVETFYAAHETFTVGVLSAPCEMLAALGRRIKAAALAKRLCGESAAMLKTAYRNLEPDKFPAAIGLWPTTRASAEVDKLMAPDGN